MMANTTTTRRASSSSSMNMNTSSSIYDESVMATATASSLVSETILDSPTLENRLERRAVLRSRAKDILNKGVIAAVSASVSASASTRKKGRTDKHNANNSSETNMTSGSIYGDEDNLVKGHSGRNSSGSEYRDDDDDDDDIYANQTGFGILESGKQWFQGQKDKWQKQALQEKVEAQRRILLEKTIKRNKARKMRSSRSPSSASYVDGKIGFSMMENGNRSLGDNEAYQSITQRYKDGSGNENEQNESMGIGLCGGVLVDDEDEDYVVEGDDTSEFDDKDGTGHGHAAQDKSTILDQSAHNSLNMSGDDEDSFRIGTPHGTYTGGIAVQVELIEGAKKKKKSMIKLEQESDCNVPFILTREQMTSITELGLPPSVAFSKWRRLYSLQRDGDSFTGSFLKKIKGQEKTLLVVQTTNLEVFGAYTNSPWEAQGYSGTVNFYGSAQACLFSIDKDRLERNDENNGVLVFKWTGKNRYIQVCDLQNKMLALGGGGKDGEFGICVEDDFRVGSTGPCDTFDNAPLCSEDRFEIMNVECYGFVTGF